MHIRVHQQRAGSIFPYYAMSDIYQTHSSIWKAVAEKLDVPTGAVMIKVENGAWWTLAPRGGWQKVSEVLNK